MPTSSPTPGPTLGLDIGGTSIKCAALIHGSILRTTRSNPYSRPSRDELARAIREVWPADHRPVRVGLCLPGLFDPIAGRITASANVPALVGLDLDALLREALGYAPSNRVCTDAHAAAFDLYTLERAEGLAPGRYFALSLGTGAGASVLDDGQPLRVSGDSPGHFGQLDVSLDDHAPIGPDGGRGSLESYIGLPALLARYGPPADTLASRLNPADPPLRALARALRIAHAMYRPQHLRLLGGVGIRLAPHLASLRLLVETDLTRIARAGWTLGCGRDDFHAARGAARLADLA